ncbi:hypothetical protein [Nocardiopsis coralliicola]
MAEGTARAVPRAAKQGSRGWWPLAAVVAVAVLLVGGLALAGRVIDDVRPVPAGQPLPIGAGDGHTAEITLGGGWDISLGSSQADQEYVLTRGPVTLQISNVVTQAASDAQAYWHGLGRIVRSGDASARLGEPAPLTAAGGAPGLAGPLESDSHTGRAAVLPSPDRDFAVEMQLTAPDGTGAPELRAAGRALEAVAFTPNQGGGA